MQYLAQAMANKVGYCDLGDLVPDNPSHINWQAGLANKIVKSKQISFDINYEQAYYRLVT